MGILINTPTLKAEQLEVKQSVLQIVEQIGFINDEGIPNVILTAEKTESNNIDFFFEGKTLGTLISGREEGILKKEDVLPLLNNQTKVFGLVAEEGRRLVADIFDKVAVMQANGEIPSDALIEESKGVDGIMADLLAQPEFPFAEAELEERITYARKNKVSDKNICWMLKQLEGEKVAKPPMMFKEPQNQVDAFGYTCERGIFERVVSAFRLKQHVILDGPKGTGKDVCLETVAWFLNMPFISHTMTMDVTKEDLLGDYITDNAPVSVKKHSGFFHGLKGGIKALFGAEEVVDDTLNTMAEVFKPKVVFEASSVVTALQTGRCILNLDEMNLANTGVLSGIVNTIADNHSAYIYVRGVGKVPISKDTHVTATMNGLDCDYDGTQPLNVATDDRFKTIRFSNPTGSVFDILLSMKTGASQTHLKLVDDIFQALRDLYLYGIDGVQGVVTDKCVSMRACRRMLLDLADGASEYESFRDNFLNKLPKDEAEIIEPVIVTKLIQPPL